MVFVLRLEQCKRSMLRFPLHPTALPLTYIFPWRARNWFLAIDLHGDGELSHEELRTHSFQNPLQIWLNYRTDRALLTNARKILCCSRHKSQSSLVPISRQAALPHHGEVSRERLCMFLSVSFWRSLMTFIL